MNDIPNGFKHKLFGGFKQNDVMKYIKRLAAQRNEYHDMFEKASLENEVLQDKLSQLRARVEELEALVSESNCENCAKAIVAEMPELEEELEYPANDENDIPTVAGSDVLAFEKISAPTFVENEEAPALKTEFSEITEDVPVIKEFSEITEDDNAVEIPAEVEVVPIEAEGTKPAAKIKLRRNASR